MAVIHGKTAVGSIVPVRVDNSGQLIIELAAVTIEASFGGLPEHWNGTATDVAATITFSDTSRSIMIDNIGIVNDLLFSFDGGTKWKTLPPEASISIMCDRDDIEVKCGAGLTTDYEIIVVVAE